MPTPAEIVEQNKTYALASWIAQKEWQPIAMMRAEGVYFWDGDGKRYLDWPSQLINVNVGHGHPRVIRAIQEQAGKLCYAYPGMATESRGRLAELLAAITPGSLKKTFFSNSGAEAIENAMKMARLMTGRQKILTRYRSYHGATMGALTATGGPRRLATEPGVPWIVRLPDPYAYRSTVYEGRTQEQGDRIIADMIEEIVHCEGPANCAAILWESYSGASGVIQPSAAFFSRLTEICQRYGILLILDEVMSGFGRTGEWFGINHYPDVKADIMCLAKGLTSGYVPLGATVVSDEVAAYFDSHPLATGSTTSGHALACAAGIACIEVYRDEHLVENARDMGKTLRRGLLDLAEKHPVVGDVRGTGLLQVIELVQTRETRKPLSGFNQPLSEPMRLLGQAVREGGLHPYIIGNFFFNCPPLCISEAQIGEGLAIIDHALAQIDRYYEG